MTLQSIFLAGIFSHVGTAVALGNSHFLSWLSGMSWKSFVRDIIRNYLVLCLPYSCSIALMASGGQMHFLF